MLEKEFEQARKLDDKIKSIDKLLRSWKIVICGEYTNQKVVVELDKEMKNKFYDFLLNERDELQREFNNLLYSRKDEGLEK